MKNVILIVFLLLVSQLSAQYKQENTRLIHKYLDFKSENVSPRTIEVLLPPNYDAKRKYPVLYMHDGQMLFDATTTWNNQEWGVDEVVYKLINEKQTKAFVTVGIHFGNRYLEYMPQKPTDELKHIDKTDKFKGEIVSDNYLKFIVDELKPFIDNTYSTKTNAQNTFIMGSSMGGLISCYAICEYPDVFGGAACMSTHWPALEGVFLKYVSNKLPKALSHKIYFDHGTKTLDSLYKPFQNKVDIMMKNKGYEKNINWITQEFKGAKHDENAWRERLHIPIIFLLGENK